MARTITDEKIKLSIEINGDPAQKEINDLEKSTIRLKQKVSDLNYERKMVEKQLGKESAEYKKLTIEINQHNLKIDQQSNKLKELISALKVSDMTMAQLRQKATLLSSTLAHLAPETDDWKRYDADLKAVQARMVELRGNAKQSGLSLSSMADGFNKYQGLFLSAAATVTGVVFSIQKIIDINGKLSDSQADVMKTTGMNKKEVDELTKSFGALETRTSRIDLLKIAEQGGRIGINKAEIGDFVNVMNKAAVALGDSFTGGAEEVSNKLGKIKFLFQETKDLNVDQAYNAIGSAINDLGANGVASEANIAEFTTRIGSLTDVLKPTIQETLALGTAFEESGIEAEVSSRAYGIFMKQASTESAKFAQVMGVSQKSVEDMINTNPLDFMLKFAEGMKGMDATETAKTLDFLGISADGANKVIGAMGNNTARFRELIDLSNNSFASGTSLINEYTIKNETLGATLEKIGKKVSGMFSSETFIQWLTVAVNGFARFIGATEDAEQKVSGWRIGLALTAKLLGVLIASIFGFSIANRLAVLEIKSFGVATAWANLQSKLNVMWLTLQKTGLIAYSFVMKLFGQEAERTTIKIRALNIAGAASPWGAIIALVTTLIGLYAAYRTSINKATVEHDSFAKQQKTLADEVGKSTAQTKAHISSLVNVINDGNVSLASRKKAYEELVKIAPEFNGLIIKEGEKVAGLLTIYADYIKALDQVAYAKGLAKLNESNIEKEINAQQRLYNAEKKLSIEREAFEKKAVRTKSGVNVYGTKSQGMVNAEKELESAKLNLDNIQIITNKTNDFKKSVVATLESNIKVREKQLDDLEKKHGESVKTKSRAYISIATKLKDDKQKLDALLGASPTDPNAKSNFKVPGGKDKDDAAKKREDENKKFIEDTKKLIDERLKLEREAEDARLANLPEGYAKEIKIEQVNFDRKIADLKSQLIKEEDIKTAFANASNEKLSKQERAFWKAQADVWQTKNDTNNSKIESATIAHNLKIADIEFKASNEAFKQLSEKYDNEKTLRETQFNLDLAKLGTNEAAKLKLKKDYDKKELDAEERKLTDLSNLLRFQMSSLGAFNLISPEEKDKLQKQLDFVLNALAKIKAAQSGQTDSKDKSALEGFGAAAFTNLDTLEEKLRAGDMVIKSLQNVWSQYATFQKAGEDRELKNYERTANAKKATLKKQLDNGMISQAYYNRHIEKIDKDLDRKKAEIEYNQAKREKSMALVSAIISTAKGVAAALPNLFLASIAAIMGGLQIATIAKQPLPAKGYEKGLYGDYVKREQDGKVFQAQYGGTTKSGVVTKPTYFLTGENGPEMIIDKRAYASLSSGTRDSLLRELRGIKGYEQGLYNQQTKRYEVPATPQEQSQAQVASGDMQMLMSILAQNNAVIAENLAVMKDLRDQGVFVTNKDLQSMKNLRDGIKSYEELRTKNKR